MKASPLVLLTPLKVTVQVQLALARVALNRYTLHQTDNLIDGATFLELNEEDVKEVV